LLAPSSNVLGKGLGWRTHESGTGASADPTSLPAYVSPLSLLTSSTANRMRRNWMGSDVKTVSEWSQEKLVTQVAALARGGGVRWQSRFPCRVVSCGRLSMVEVPVVSLYPTWRFDVVRT
jgi:hypothetical protein